MNIKEHNEKMMKKFGYLSMILKEIENKVINHISFQPFEDMEISRKYDIGNAYQIKELDNNKIDIYYEPVELYPGNKIIFIKDIPEKGINKGDTGEIYRISTSGNLEVDLDKNDEKGRAMSVRGISPLTCVYDTEYKFAHFCKVETENKGYLSGNENSGFKQVGHFTDSDYLFIHSIRYKGKFNKQMAISLREQFMKEKPGLVKLEEEGKCALLLMDRYPGNNSKSEPTEMDAYRRPKKYSDLKVVKEIKNKPKM